MAFNSRIAIATINLKIEELEARKRAWEEEAQRLWNAIVDALEEAGRAEVAGALEEARLEAIGMANRYGEQIDTLSCELDAIEAGPGYFRPHRK